MAVRGGELHIWDATDDIREASLDLLFEGDRVYLHNATGKFGAVPMRLAGDLDLDAEAGGQYRLSATVPGVEVNQLRATLGVRPTPFPVAGAVAGTLHVTGPLEKPVFSGTAEVVRPGAEMLADCEPTAALATLQGEPFAVGAYDKVPFQSAGVVFTLDTRTETMLLHDMHAEPVGGGRVSRCFLAVADCCWEGGSWLGCLWPGHACGAVLAQPACCAARWLTAHPPP